MISIVCELYKNKEHMDEGILGDIAYTVGKRLPGVGGAEKKRQQFNQRKKMLKRTQRAAYGGYGSKSYAM